jgi:hypothetical protein
MRSSAYCVVSLPSLFEELSNDLQHAKSEGALRQFINSKDNALSLEKSRQKIDAIIRDANVCAVIYSELVLFTGLVVAYLDC